MYCSGIGDMHIGLTELPASSLHFLQLLLAVKSLEMSAGRNGVALGKSGTLHSLIDGSLPRVKGQTPLRDPPGLTTDGCTY